MAIGTEADVVVYNTQVGPTSASLHAHARSMSASHPNVNGDVATSHVKAALSTWSALARGG